MYDFDGEFDDPEEAVDDKELNQLIDTWLAGVRPERYDSTEKDWMDSAVEKARQALKNRRADDEVIRDAARRRVHQRETQATKRANKELRNISERGELPLGWGEGDDWRKLLFDILHLPLSIAKQRVRFGAASATDFADWELENAREEDKRKLAQISARNGARLIAEWMRSQGVQRAEDLRTEGGTGEATP